MAEFAVAKKNILINAALGGVGHYALQRAKLGRWMLVMHFSKRQLITGGHSSVIGLHYIMTFPFLISTLWNCYPIFFCFVLCLIIWFSFYLIVVIMNEEIEGISRIHFLVQQWSHRCTGTKEKRWEYICLPVTNCRCSL